jgi:crotonobetainyl-CoA:carnitine CoA-transferase CaiB-like acyl-CoA transferase
VFGAAPRQKEWEALAAAIGCAYLVGDTRFATAEARHDNAQALLT